MLAGAGQKAMPLQQTVLVLLFPGAWAPTLDDVVLSPPPHFACQVYQIQMPILSMGHPQWYIKDSLIWIAPQVPSHCWELALSCTLLSRLKVGPSTREGKGAMSMSKEIRSSLAVILSCEVALTSAISPQEWHTGIVILSYSCCCCSWSEGHVLWLWPPPPCSENFSD